ncbi:hypothetical protein CQA53_00730 [Helicobacter didelphidarum]|uniref:Uncharacterized protein n=1 Tax=Helicobacter didelphidarum TaxID=2040648 RepID=A0A3D8IT01_9HELI|nr:hypothetical protein CQA53_00730 [Helicobacter didelphidarum]
MPNNELLHRLQIAEKELQIQKATTKNALKVSIFIGIFCVFAVALNFSILVTLAGGIAGTDKKLNSLLENHENKIHHNEY